MTIGCHNPTGQLKLVVLSAEPTAATPWRNDLSASSSGMFAARLDHDYMSNRAANMPQLYENRCAVAPARAALSEGTSDSRNRRRRAIAAAGAILPVLGSI